MLYLRDTHGRFAAVCLHEVVRVVEGAAHLYNNLHTSGLGLGNHVRISVARIGIGVLFKDEMRDLPNLKELPEHRLGCFADDEQFGVGVQFGDGRGEVRLAIEPVLAKQDSIAVLKGRIRCSGTTTDRYCHRLGPTRAR